MAVNVIRESDVYAMVNLMGHFVREDVLMSQMDIKAMTAESMIITVTTLGIGMNNFGALAREHVILVMVLHSDARQNSHTLKDMAIGNGMVIYAENQNLTEVGNTDAQMDVFRTLLAHLGVNKLELIYLVDCPIPWNVL